MSYVVLKQSPKCFFTDFPKKCSNDDVAYSNIRNISNLMQTNSFHMFKLFYKRRASHFDRTLDFLSIFPRMQGVLSLAI